MPCEAHPQVQLRLFGGDEVEPVTKRKDGHTDHRVKGFRAIVRQGQGTSHHAKAQAADSAGHGVAVLHDSTPKRKGAHYHGQAKADLVDDWSAQHAACRRHQRQQDCRRDAMHKAKPGQANGHPVETMRWNREWRHGRGYNVALVT